MRRHHIPESDQSSGSYNRNSTEKENHQSLTIPQPEFPTDYDSVLKRIAALDVKKYAATRNYIHGSVSFLSPYLSRGVITPMQIRELLRERYSEKESYRFIFEMAWREYFQHLWWQNGDTIFTENPEGSDSGEATMATSILMHKTGIHLIDKGIQALYETGYMHNHLRLYTASLHIHFSKEKWLSGAKWMYFHLLDADPASNFLSWQWVAGNLSGKPYLFNQSNANHFSGSVQSGTFLDHDYTQLPRSIIPKQLEERTCWKPKEDLPVFDEFELPTENRPIHLYTPFHLDPKWRSKDNSIKICWWPSHLLQELPMSMRTIQFIISISKNIPDLHHILCSFEELQTKTAGRTIISRRHPLVKHLPGIRMDTDHLMFPNLEPTGPGFMKYWKKCERELVHENHRSTN